MYVAYFKRRPHDISGGMVALIGSAVALGLVPVTSAGMPIIIGGGVAVLVGMLWGSRKPA